MRHYAQKKPKGKVVIHWNKLRNKAISNRRLVVERTFGTLKRTHGLVRAGYISLEKTTNEVNRPCKPDCVNPHIL